MPSHFLQENYVVRRSIFSSITLMETHRMYEHERYMIDECVTSLILGNTLSTSPVRVVTTILLPIASRTSTLSVFLVSQGLAVKAYGFDVRAPTGQRSITFPESSERKNFSTYVPTCGRQLKVLSVRRHHTILNPLFNFPLATLTVPVLSMAW